MKSFVLFCLFALISSNVGEFQLSEKARDFLAHVKLRDLPESVRESLLRSEGRAAADASHWCCINDQPITSVTQTKIEYMTRVIATKTKVGYVSCGFAGSMRCSHYVTAYRTVMETFIQTFQVPNMAACSSHEMKCCSGYLLVADNCHSFSDLVENQQLFQFLSGLGLLNVG